MKQLKQVEYLNENNIIIWHLVKLQLQNFSPELKKGWEQHPHLCDPMDLPCGPVTKKIYKNISIMKSIVNLGIKTINKLVYCILELLFGSNYFNIKLKHEVLLNYCLLKYSLLLTSRQRTLWHNSFLFASLSSVGFGSTISTRICALIVLGSLDTFG